MSSYGTGSTDSGGVFSWTTVHDSGNADLDWVFAGHDVDDFEGVLNDSHGEHLFTVVSASLHKSVDQSFDDVHLSFLESGLVDSSTVMRQVSTVGFVEFDVISQCHVHAFDFGQVPLAEHLWLVGMSSTASSSAPQSWVSSTAGSATATSSAQFSSVAMFFLGYSVSST